jgi:hypothetical protein
VSEPILKVGPPFANPKIVREVYDLILTRVLPMGSIYMPRVEGLKAYHYGWVTLNLGGKGGAGPSLLHIALEGPMEYVNARCM